MTKETLKFSKLLDSSGSTRGDDSLAKILRSDAPRKLDACSIAASNLSKDRLTFGIPDGTTELFGSAMEARTAVIRIIESVYREFGFDPLDTPILEHSDVFDGHHGEGESLQFHLSDSASRDLVLRYDLTVPLARYVAEHPEAPIPFKRFQIAKVFRDDEVDKGHFREFIQCDGDVVGVSDLIADAEVINMAYTGLDRLGFDDFLIKINNRKIIEAISNMSGLYDNEGRLRVQRALDAVSKLLEKINVDPLSMGEEIRKILSERDLSKEAIDFIESLFTISGGFDVMLEALKVKLGFSTEGLDGIAELEEIVSYLEPSVKDKVRLDLSLARGADYYTGFILEGSIPGVQVGAVLGGGRFDNLVKNFGGPDLPALGMAFGLERIMVAQDELGIVRKSYFDEKVLVVYSDDSQKRALYKYVMDLRSEGVNADFMSMGSFDCCHILDYAVKRGFSSLVTMGEEGIESRGFVHHSVTTLEIE